MQIKLLLALKWSLAFFGAITVWLLVYFPAAILTSTLWSWDRPMGGSPWEIVKTGFGGALDSVTTGIIMTVVGGWAFFNFAPKEGGHHIAVPLFGFTVSAISMGGVVFFCFNSAPSSALVLTGAMAVAIPYTISLYLNLRPRQ